MTSTRHVEKSAYSKFIALLAGLCHGRVALARFKFKYGQSGRQNVHLPREMSSVQIKNKLPHGIKHTNDREHAMNMHAVNTA